MRSLYSISVHNPFDDRRLWAAGLPNMLRTETDIRQRSKYKESSIAQVVAVLRREHPDLVVTVY